jgi:hypothetical protein
MLELIACSHQVKGGTGDQVEAFQDAVDTRFRDEVAFGVGEIPGQLAWRLVRPFQGDRNDLLTHAIRYPVPELLRSGLVVG